MLLIGWGHGLTGLHSHPASPRRAGGSRRLSTIRLTQPLPQYTEETDRVEPHHLVPGSDVARDESFANFDPEGGPPVANREVIESDDIRALLGVVGRLRKGYAEPPDVTMA